MLTSEVTIWLAFLAGVLSFVSPCMLPLYPSYLSYITGVSVEQIQQGGDLATTAGYAPYPELHSWFFCDLFCFRLVGQPDWPVISSVSDMAADHWWCGHHSDGAIDDGLI